jgi:hypothetical protein
VAVVQFHISLDMHTPTPGFATLVAWDSSHIQLTNGPIFYTYYGNFTFGNVSGTTLTDFSGTLTGATRTTSGILDTSITGGSVPANTIFQLIQSGQGQAANQIVYAGNDQFTVQPGTHVIDGYGGYNTVTEPSPVAAYKIAKSGSSVLVNNASGNPVLTSDTLFNIQQIVFPDGYYDTQSGIFVPNVSSGLLASLSISQQLELIYVAYFNRAADAGGSTFWSGQNVQAQGRGQSAAVALSNISNSFQPQPEAIALYPFFGTPNLNLNSPSGQFAVGGFVNSVFSNLFSHAADTVGLNYWIGQISSGAVGAGTSALAIANGATGSDATELQNKIAVAQDFTTRTNAAGLGLSAPLPSSFLPAAHNVLNSVDGTSLNDASVTAGMNATTAYVSAASTSKANVLASGTGASLAAPQISSVSASTGLNAPALTFIGTPTVVTLGGTVDSAQFTLTNGSGIETIANFQYGVDQLNLDLSGADASVLRTFDTTVDGSHAIAIASSNDLGHGVMLLNMPTADTASALLASHITIMEGHALIG